MPVVLVCSDFALSLGWAPQPGLRGPEFPGKMQWHPFSPRNSDTKCKKCSTPGPEVVKSPAYRQKAQPSAYQPAGLVIPSVGPGSSETKRWIHKPTVQDLAGNVLFCLGPWSLNGACKQGSLPLPPYWNGAAGIMLLRWQSPSPCEPKTAEAIKDWAAGMNIRSCIFGW